MTRCAYFFDKVTQKIIGMNIHHERNPDNPESIQPADCNLDDNWEAIRTGTQWPHLLNAVTDKNPDNLGLLYADDIATGYNEFKPCCFKNSKQLERRPYICLQVLPNERIARSEEKEKHCLHVVNTEGGITLDMKVTIKTTQKDCVEHSKDKNVSNINCELQAECTYGRLIPRDGKILLKNSEAIFQWHLPDTTTNTIVCCYVKDPTGELIISKSLRVKCC